MIRDSLIVEDIRRVRRAISERFAHDVDEYIDYLQKSVSHQIKGISWNPLQNRRQIQEKSRATRFNLWALNSLRHLSDTP